MALQWHEFSNKETLDQQLAATIADELKKAIAARGTAGLAVSGGRTPAGMFKALRNSDLDWSRVVITLVDERWVQPDHADSNERLTRENLLQDGAAAATFVSLVNTQATPHEALAEIEARLAKMPNPIDVVILGMGDDGHTASLFPAAAELEAACESTALLAAVTPPVAPHQRITLTLPTIVKSPKVLVHITGESKKELLLNAMAANVALTEQYPIRRVLDQVPLANVFWAA
ncbi:6-phosphogluconolactonase [Chitinibacter bivalviorum]|uniref:6-phosphogluconolactonase n=1 Tax=Chitinibacter bivalviorum TaxID=2739434 RepID=A0A7H9BFX2_9NEIS|nr:6-phosphogluconolactonase [Chitinibacter bivalviorum]QLG86811.1 6-phosphogluconolactonase [Chitinibacter bivalviorum]